MKSIDLSQWDRTSPHVHLNDGLSQEPPLVDVQFSHCLLTDKYLRDCVFKGGTLQHCRLEFCNLRNASFERVNFTGTSFIDCDLRKASFIGCILWYTSFTRCQLDYDAVLECEPHETNIKRVFLRSLRLNAASTGDKEWVDRLHLRELRAERDDLWNIVWQRSAYYRTKYTPHDRVQSAWRLLRNWSSNLFWGHGISLRRLVTAGAVVTCLFALLCWKLSARYIVAGTASPRHLTFLESVYYSAVSFTTGGFGDIMPGNAMARAITATEGLVGAVFLGFFAAAVYRRLSR